MSQLKDMTGLKFGKLLITRRYEINSKKDKAQWVCKCDCGNEIIAVGADIRNGRYVSCGCSKEKHKLSNDILYPIWASMKQRCYLETNHAYKDYGGRGIKVCEEWTDEKNGFINFYNWATNNGYSEKLTIDRINNDSNYEPSNCRWVTMKVQCNNRRNNHIVEYNGESKTLAEWCSILNFSHEAMEYRLKAGWSIEKAFTTPNLRPRKKVI